MLIISWSSCNGNWNLIFKSRFCYNLLSVQASFKTAYETEEINCIQTQLPPVTITISSFFLSFFLSLPLFCLCHSLSFFLSHTHTRRHSGRKEPLPNDVSTLRGGLDARQRAITNALTSIILCWRTLSPCDRTHFTELPAASFQTRADSLHLFFAHAPAEAPLTCLLSHYTSEEEARK